jgi:hypothetical protein
MAFVENFLPGFNLLRVPAIVRDVVHRLEPLPSRGEAFIFAAWIGLLGGFFVPRIGALLFGVTVQSEPDTLRRYLAIEAIATGFVLIGAVFLVALIWWVEGRITRRRAAQLAGGSATPEAPVAPPTVTPQVGTPTVAPQIAPDVVYTRSAFAAAGSASAATPDGPPPSAPPPVSPPPFALPRVTTEPVDAPPREPLIEPGPALEPGIWPAPTAETAPEPVVEQEATVGIDEGAAVQTAPEPQPAPAPEPLVRSVPERVVAGEPESMMATEPEPIVEPQPGPDQVAASATTPGGPPHLTIRVATRGMITAEMDGETEHVILDDLEAYGSALAKVGGTAAIVVSTDDSMAGLIARRAQRILEDAGVQVSVG